MARQMHSPDFQAPDLEGVIDYAMLKRGLAQITPVTEREFKDIAEIESFMNDLLVIEVHTTTDKNAPLIAEIGVNGDKVVIPRGRKVRIPRKFVERLAQAQSASFKTTPNPNPGADEGMITTRHNGQEYPFTVHHDPSPKGRAWLSRMVREGS